MKNFVAMCVTFCLFLFLGIFAPAMVSSKNDVVVVLCIFSVICALFAYYQFMLQYYFNDKENS